MNEFIEQFLLECRELIEIGSADLLALEKHTGDRERIDSAFRAFHTLKGSAGIVEFTAMGRAVHAAEDALAAVRAGTRPVTPALISDCLTCLDQVVQWLDAMQATGEMPPDAGRESEAIVARFGRGTEALPVAARGAYDETSWTDVLLDRHDAARTRAKTAVRYTPDSDCFFAGEDPVALVAKVPGLLALDMHPVVPWPGLESLEPFVCNLIFTFLSEGDVEAVTAALGPAAAQADIVALVGAGAKADLPAHARALLVAQTALLDVTEGEIVSGCIASAATAAANVLRHLSRPGDASRIRDAAVRSLADKAPHQLRQAIEAVLSGHEGAAPVAGQAVHTAAAVRTLRVEAAQIDGFVRLTGELTVTKNAIGHVVRLAQEQGSELAALLKDRYVDLDRLVTALQRSVLDLRVLPLRHVFQRFPRVVREMSRDLGKPAELVIEGEDTQADKTIVEMLFEPLLHVLRNAMDHGIETAAARTAMGKAPVASIRLSALRHGEHVVVEIKDDGRGIDADKLRAAAVTKGILTPDAAAAAGEAEIVNLIFAPGFSTAAQVTGLSGRGVGMDAVRTAVEKVGGQVSIETQVGHGTAVRFTLPFSVMMTRVMTVESGGQMFGIPLDAVVETVKIPTSAVTPVGAAAAIVYRERTVPLLELASTLGAPSVPAVEAEITVVVTRVSGQLGALRVQRIGERLDVVLKPLDGLLAGMTGIAGTTLLGDGRVLLVLDLAELVQ